MGRSRPRQFVQFLLAGDVVLVAVGAIAFYLLVGPSVELASGVMLPPAAWAALGAMFMLASCLSSAWWMTGRVFLEPTRIRVTDEGVDLEVGLFPQLATPVNLLWSQLQSPPRTGRPGYVLTRFTDRMGNPRSQVVLSVEQFRAIWAHPGHPESWTYPERIQLAGAPLSPGNP
ncbi:MAG: hypothetical protein L3K03_05090 [Thermoplasmata archaeon]|nr:hypothetical protein [Thermoplasmata archaeon]